MFSKRAMSNNNRKRARPLAAALPSADELLQGANSARLEQLKSCAQAALDAQAVAAGRPRKLKQGEVMCFVCETRADKATAYTCGSDGAGVECGPDELERGGCGEWAHRKCLGKTRCKLVRVCHDCLLSYECVDCDQCMGYY